MHRKVNTVHEKRAIHIYTYLFKDVLKTPFTNSTHTLKRYLNKTQSIIIKFKYSHQYRWTVNDFIQPLQNVS